MSWLAKINLHRHRAALVLAIVVGVLSVTPHLLAVRSIGSAYRDIPFMYTDDEDIYLARMQEIVDGHPSVGSAFFYEYKNDRALLPPIGEYVYVGLSRATGLVLAQTLVLAKFLFPALLFLLIYAFLRRLLTSEPPRLQTLGAIAGGLLVTLGYDLLSIQDIWSLLHGQDIGVRVSLWTRPVNPILGALLVFGYLNLLWKALEERRLWVGVLAGILLGASVFYFFSWGVLISVTAVLGAIFLAQKDWRRVKQVAIVVGTSFIVSAPYWISTFRSVGGEVGRALALRNGMFFTHAPLLNKTLLAALILFLLASAYLVRRGTSWRELTREPWWIVSASLLLGGLLALNQQIVTGREIWPYHFVQYTKPFAMIVVIVILIRAVGARWSRAVGAACGAFLLFVILQAGAAAVTHQSVLPDFKKRQADAELFDWLNRNASPDCVVLVKEPVEHLARFIPAFTHCNTYISSWVFSGVPEDRIAHNFFLHLRLQGVTSANVRSYLLSHPNLVRSSFFDDWKTIFMTGVDDWLLRQIDVLEPRYRVFLQQNALDQLHAYRVDYFVSDALLSSDERKAWAIKGDPIPIGGHLLYLL